MKNTVTSKVTPGTGTILRLALAPDTRIRAFKLSAVVGTILLLINQWEACLGEVPVQWAKAILTYCVPYLVSTYTSVMKDYESLRQGDDPGVSAK